MELIETIKKRKSIRCFKKGGSVPERKIKLILEAARYAPSAKNLQPIEFIRVKDQKVKEALAHAARQRQPADVPLVIVVIGDFNLAKKVGVVSTHDKTTEEKGIYRFLYMDMGAAIENMLLEATSLGIDSLWIGSFEEKEVYKALDLPEDYMPLAILCFGERQKPPFAPKKRPIAERLYIDGFAKKKQDFAYLEECKLINEDPGELSNY